MTVRKGWERIRLAVWVGFAVCFTTVAAGAWAQLNLSEVDPLEFVNFVRGDMEINNLNEPNEEILYSNSDPKGTVELEVITQKSKVSVQAKTIRLRSGKTEVLAEGGVIIDDGTTSVRSNSAKYWVDKGIGEFSGNAEFRQRVDKDRSNGWKGNKIEVTFGDGKVKKIKMLDGGGRLYPQKGQMSRFMTGQKPPGGATKAAPKAPVATKVPQATPTAKPLERILAPMAE